MSVTIGILERYKSKHIFIHRLPITFSDSFVYKDDWKEIAGTVTITDESNSVAGTLTKFTEELKVGDKIKIMDAVHAESSDTNEFTVATITSDTALTVTEETIADTGGSIGAKAYKVCPNDEKYIPVDIKKHLGLQVVFLVTGVNTGGYYFMYNHTDGTIRAYASGGTEAELLDPDESEDGDQLQDTTAVILAMGR